MRTQNQFLFCSPFDDEIRKFGAESSFGKLTSFNFPDDAHYIRLFFEFMFSTIGFPKMFPEENWFLSYQLYYF